MVLCVSKNVRATRAGAQAGEDGTRGETCGKPGEVAAKKDMEATGAHGSTQR